MLDSLERCLFSYSYSVSTYFCVLFKKLAFYSSINLTSFGYLLIIPNYASIIYQGLAMIQCLKYRVSLAKWALANSNTGNETSTFLVFVVGCKESS